MRRRTLLAALPLALLPAALPLSAAGPALAHPPRQPDRVESQSLIEEIKVFRGRLAKAVAEKDVKALRSMYADAFTHTHGSGEMDDKNARIALALAGELLIENAPASELSYRVFAGPTVVVTGRSAIPDGGDRKTGDLRWVAVYVTGRDGWLLAVSQATRLPG